MSNPHDKAAAARMFRDDPTYKELKQEIIDAQVSVFKNPDSTPEDRETAHEIIRALGKLDNAIDARLAESAIRKRKEERAAP